MNALELAEQLEIVSWGSAQKEAATMLRAQHEAIKTLREALEVIKDNSNDFGAIACATDALAATEKL